MKSENDKELTMFLAEWDKHLEQFMAINTKAFFTEIAPLDKSFFENAKLRLPGTKQSITVRLDSDVLEWFRAQGKGYQTRMNAVLRLYMESQKIGSA